MSAKRLMRLLWVSVLVFGFSIQGAFADNGPLKLGEVVVTATRTEVPVDELGVSATVITAEDIEESQATDVSELLRDEAGFILVRSGSRGNVTAVYPRGGESNYTLVMIDGVQVNLGGGGFDFDTLTTDNIERIEIIRGPQSALYGSDAIGGVIQIITKRGTGDPTATVSTAHGAHSENGSYIGEQKFSFFGGWEGGGFSMAYGRVDDGGILDINNDFTNNTFSSRLDLYPSDKVDLTLTTRYENSRYEYPTESNGDLYSPLDPDQSDEEQDFLTGLTARIELCPFFENVIQIGFHRNENEFDDPLNPETDYAESLTNTKENRATADYHFNIRFPREGVLKSTFTLGYEFEYEAYDQFSLYGADISNLDEKRWNHGYYMQEQLSLFDRLHLTAGFRVEDNSEYGVEISPRGSLAYVIKSTGTKIRGSAGTGIKEPTFYENFVRSAYAIGNPDLKPEKSVSWEVGIDQNLFEDKVELGLTFFKNNYKDLIAYIAPPYPLPEDPPPSYVNIQEAESQGVEFTAKYRPGWGLTFGGSFTYLDTEVTDDGGLGAEGSDFIKGAKLLRRPDYTFSIYGDWLWKGFHAHVKGLYVGERDDRDFRSYPATRITMDDYFVVDANVDYTFTNLGRCPVKAIKLFAKGRNVLDEDYEEVFGFSSPRISALAGVELTF